MIGTPAHIYNAVSTLSEALQSAGLDHGVELRLSSEDGRQLERMIAESAGGNFYRGEIVEPYATADGARAIDMNGVKVSWPEG